MKFADIHCVKCAQIRSFFWSVFSRIRTGSGDLLRKFPYSVRVRENTDQKKTPYLDTFYAVIFGQHNIELELQEELNFFLFFLTSVYYNEK